MNHRVDLRLCKHPVKQGDHCINPHTHQVRKRCTNKAKRHNKYECYNPDKARNRHYRNAKNFFQFIYPDRAAVCPCKLIE